MGRDTISDFKTSDAETGDAETSDRESSKNKLSLSRGLDTIYLLKIEHLRDLGTSNLRGLDSSHVFKGFWVRENILGHVSETELYIPKM